jgi:SET domain-containing protein
MTHKAQARHPETIHIARVENRITVRPSGIEGRGVFAVGDLPARRKLGEISGVLVRLPHARIRVAAARRIYLIELSRRYALDCSRGNVFKHLNHACRPNCYLRVFRKRVEVYTLRRIRAGAELTVDYGVTPHRGGMKCRCGAAGCRGEL